MLLAAGNSIDGIVHYLAALAAGHVVLMSSGESAVQQLLMATYDPDVVVHAAGGSVAVVHRRTGPAMCSTPSSPSSCPPRDRPDHPAGRPLVHEPAVQRRGHRHLPRPHPERPSHDQLADPLLLRPVRAPQPPDRRRLTGRHRHLRGRRVLLERAATMVGHQLRRRPPHLRAARPHRVRTDGSPEPALHHPGRREDAGRHRCPLRPARPRTQVEAVRHVRPDRSHRPHGLPATAPGRDAPHGLVAAFALPSLCREMPIRPRAAAALADLAITSS